MKIKRTGSPHPTPTAIRFMKILFSYILYFILFSYYLISSQLVSSLSYCTDGKTASRYPQINSTTGYLPSGESEAKNMEVKGGILGMLGRKAEAKEKKWRVAEIDIIRALYAHIS